MSHLTGAGRRAGQAVAVGAVAVLGATACSSTAGSTINAGSAARQISAELAARYHLSPPAVTCPSGVPARKGRTFVCTATLGGQPARLDATVTGNSGRFTISSADPILVPSSVAAQLTGEIKARTGQQPSVSCPGGPVVVVPVQRSLTCSATFSGQAPRTVTVTVVDRRGDFSFQLAPPS